MKGAWVRTENNDYGWQKYPFGKCTEPACDRAACFKIPSEAERSGARVVCLKHKPDNIVFIPFLGQQTKLFKAKERWVLGGGGAGPGKTYAGSRLYLKQWRVAEKRYQEAKREGRHYRSKGWALFLRRTVPELKQVIADFREYVEQIDPGAKWNENDKVCTFSNGYRVQFGGMEDESDYLKYYGGEYTLVVIDEAVQFTRKMIEEIDSRIRTVDPDMQPMLQLYLLTNPVGPTATAALTKQWLKKQFKNKGPEEVPIPRSRKLKDGRIITAFQVYIPCNVYDNPALMEDGVYEANLRFKNLAQREALLNNNWDLDEGAWVGDAWDSEVHVCDPFPIPKTCRKFKMGDFGSGTSRGAGLTSIQWAAVFPDGWMVIYRARNFKGLTARDVAARIKQIESLPLDWVNPETNKRIRVTEAEWDEEGDCSTVLGPMDAACWALQGEGPETRGEQFDNAGCGFFQSAKGSKVREQGADFILFRLRSRHADSRGSLNPGIPGIRWFHTTTETKLVDEDGQPYMVGPIHSIPTVPFDENNPAVWDGDAPGNDDLDGLCYGMLSRPPGAERDEEAEVLDFMRARHPSQVGKEKIQW